MSVSTARVGRELYSSFVKELRSRPRDEADFAMSWPSSNANAVVMHNKLDRPSVRVVNSAALLIGSPPTTSPHKGRSGSTMRVFRTSSKSPKKSWLMRWASTNVSE